MNNEIATNKAVLPAMQMDEAELMNVLRNSLYPGAQDDSIKLAVSYCKAAGLDIMQKPVHLVPMWDSKTKRPKDVIMPGIGLYRTQAARSGAYAGVTEPEFGVEVTEVFPEESGYEGKHIPALTVTYPASCKVIVKRLMPDGQLAEFAATERWKENYATAGKNSKQPNSMWARRPYGQLAKCAEAQALRKAFPEVGSAPTADEMEGREIDMGSIDRSTGEVTRLEKTELPPCEDKSIERWFSNVESGKAQACNLMDFAKNKFTLSDVQEGRILAFVAAKNNPPIDSEFTAEYEGAEK
jgi:phage recombination protein Bet